MRTVGKALLAEIAALALVGGAGPALAAPPWSKDRTLNVDLRGAPPGTTEYSAVSTLSSNGNVCTRSMEITRTGKGEKPKIVSHTSGNCGLAGNAGLGFRPLTVPDDAPAGTTLVNVRQNGLIPPSAVAARGSLQF